MIVTSGSMEPNIKTGSITIDKKLSEYQKGDVITYSREGKVVTHRIIEVEGEGSEKEYKTKGDANESEDRGMIKNSEVIGKVIFSMIYLGYVIMFAKTKAGIVTLVLVPAAVLIGSQVMKIRKELKKRKKKGKSVIGEKEKEAKIAKEKERKEEKAEKSKSGGSPFLDN